MFLKSNDSFMARGAEVKAPRSRFYCCRDALLEKKVTGTLLRHRLIRGAVLDIQDVALAQKDSGGCIRTIQLDHDAEAAHRQIFANDALEERAGLRQQPK